MDKNYYSYLSQHFPKISSASAQAVLALHEEGATVPFMARYRKEKTGNLDEVEIRGVLDLFEKFNEIVKRKAFILKEIDGQGNLTDDLKKSIELSLDLGELEELYRPFKKKKKTKGKIAEEAGLSPLAEWLLGLGNSTIQDPTTLEVKAKNYLNLAAQFVTYDLVLKGAQDIIVERIYNNPDLRKVVRDHYFQKGRVASTVGKKFKAHSKFEMYKEFEEAVPSLMQQKASHRYLAMRRGWNEDELAVTIKGDDDQLLTQFIAFVAPQPQPQVEEYLHQAAKIALTVHVIPSISNEIHRALKEKADEDAISVFAENVRKVLLASPFGARCVLGVDPGLRTGCKVALIDKQGSFISHTILQILGDDAETKARKLFEDVLKQIEIDAIAVGNGTAGRETEVFLRKILKTIGANVPVVMVNESGASVYSASDVARHEFPDLDLTVRGAISIARRLQDPLAELVKLDPKSIGVGQYQHDVAQPELKKGLEGVVESCVNHVGVDLNTASISLLQYVSGIGPALAQNIVERRKKDGLFQDRSELLKVTQFSTKAFEQAAGFLRIPNGKMILDTTGIHPERYSAVREMAQEMGISVSQLVGDGAKKLTEQRTKWAALVGEYTFDDIVRELEKPGRDPRDPFKVFAFRDDIFEVKDLKAGMICPGIVTNVTNFGAFVDIGVHQDGLVHISALSTKFVDNPNKVVSPGDQVTIKVIGVDLEKNQISLSMILQDQPPQRSRTNTDDARPAARRDSRSGQPQPAGGQGDRGQQRGPRPPAAARGGPGGPRPARGADDRSRSAGPGRPSDGHGRGDRKDRPPRGGGSEGGPRPPQRKPSQPFNNPFAGLLTQINKK
jgi:uncharacterized protein